MLPDKIVDINEFERLILTNWTKFIDPKKLFALVLTKIKDSQLNKIKNEKTQSSSMKITLSNFSAAPNNTFLIWVDFTIPKQEGIAIGTCELVFNPFKKTIEHINTIGNILTN